MDSSPVHRSPNGDLNQNVVEVSHEKKKKKFKNRRHSAPDIPAIMTRSRSRPSYVVPKKDQIRQRKLSGTYSKRALSPMINDRVRQYLSKADEKLEDVLERIVQKVHDTAENAQVKVQNCVQKLRDWKACHFDKLPDWMRDNEYLHFGHRPQLPEFAECFRSIFRIHSETGNIWTHLIGFVAFVIATIVFYVKPFCDNCHHDIQVNDKLIFLCFFIGAIICLAFSTLFHTVSCHSKSIQNIFSRMDYAGIALLIVGSTIPWLYYGFYCQFYAKLTYIIAVSVCGISVMILMLLEKFNQPEYRVFRAAIFVALGLISALPIIHFLIENGISDSFEKGSLTNLLTMGALYITGAGLYAARIPERFLPGKCDIWFQSHQIFHLLVVAAAFVHYHGISEMALHRVTKLGPMCPPNFPMVPTTTGLDGGENDTTHM